MDIQMFTYFIVVIVIIGCVLIGNYIFYTITKGSYLSKLDENENILDHRFILNEESNVHVALIQGYIQNMFPELFEKYSKYMAGYIFVKEVVNNYYDCEKCNHKLKSFTRKIIRINSNDIKYYNKLLKAVEKAIELTPKP